MNFNTDSRRKAGGPTADNKNCEAKSLQNGLCSDVTVTVAIQRAFSWTGLMALRDVQG